MLTRPHPAPQSKAEGDERCGNRYCQVSMQLLSALGLKKATVLPRCNSCASFSSRNRATKQKGERPANQCHSTILGYFARLGPGDELHEALKDEVSCGNRAAASTQDGLRMGCCRQH